MLVIYGEASYMDNSALQHVRNLRKEIPQVCLLSRITLDSEGEKILRAETAGIFAVGAIETIWS